MVNWVCLLWSMQVPMLRTAEGSCGGPGLLDGLVHVRFGFNRVALRSMQHAVAIAAGKQQDPHTCWVPSLLTPFQPRAAGMRSREQEVGDQALRARLKLLQPQADEVAATAAALAERGKQKLNAGVVLRQGWLYEDQKHLLLGIWGGAASPGGQWRPYGDNVERTSVFSHIP